jgi:hypothetical protein
VSFAGSARHVAVVTLSIASVAALLACSVLGGCSSSSTAAPPKDFCGDAKSAGTTCKDPTACDTQLATDCKALDATLAPTTVSAAKDCLESGICGVATCVSRAQNSAIATAAHKTLADDYCMFCAPTLADCAANFYKRGSKSAGLAVLPYSEEIAKAVDDACTGQAGCQAKFTTCARDVIASTVAAKVDPATADCIVQGFAQDDAQAPVGPDGKPAVVTCTPSNCTGCCRDDKCEKGDASDTCGTGAKACEICSPTSKCTSGVCKEPCGPNTCRGCCDGDTCVPGTASTGCGDQGAACTKCAAALVCSNRTCIDGSCQATCTNGCCSATGCEPGTAANACGAGGEGCIDCGVGRTCQAAACQLDRTSLWDVYISFAVVPDTNKSGSSWDVLGGAPDPYLNVFTSEGMSSHSGQTSTLTDTTFPFWAETPVKGVAASELLANTSIEIWDSDVDFDDYIGGCPLPLTPAIFDGSLQSVDCPATASGVAVTVYYRINPHM